MSDISLFLEWLTKRAAAQPATPQGHAVSTELSRIGARIMAQGQQFEPRLTPRELEITRLLLLKMKRENSTNTVLA